MLIGKRLQQSVLRYHSSAPASGQIRGSGLKAAASSEIYLCYHGSGQTCTLEDGGAEGTDGQQKAKAHTTNAARLYGPVRLSQGCDQSHPRLPQKWHQMHYALQTLKKDRLKKYPLSQTSKTQLQVSPSTQDGVGAAEHLPPRCWTARYNSAPNTGELHAQGWSHPPPPAAPGWLK